MANFDLNAYFSNRLQGASAGTDKIEAITNAMSQKVSELQAYQDYLASTTQQRDAQAAMDAQSLTSRVGLDSEDPLGLGINTTVGVGKTAVDVGAWIAGAPATAWQAAQPAISTVGDLIPEPISNAYQKLDDALSIRLTNKTAQDLTRIVRDPVGLLDSTGKAAQKVVTPLYNTTVQNKLMGEMGQAYDENDGVLNVAAEMVKTAVSNPVAGAQLFITQLPYMQALAAKGVVGASAYMGMVSDFTQQSITKYKESHGGKEPGAEEMAAILGTSIASVGIEKLESMFLLNKFKGAMPGNKLLTVPAKYGTGGITEFGQETTQNLLVDVGGYQEQLLTNADLLKKSLREGVIAGGMGMASGAVGGAGMKAIQPSEAKIEAARQHAEVTAALQESISTGDYTPLIDTKSPTYAPEAAISGLFHTATQEGATPEIKQTNFEQANQILSDLNTKAEILRTLTKEKPVAADKVTATLTSNNEFITAAQKRLDTDTAITPETRSGLEKQIQQYEYENKTLTKRGRVELSNELKDVEAKLATSQQQLKQFSVENTKGIDVAAEVATVTNKASTPEQIKSSVTNLTKMAMIATDNIDNDTLNLLSSDSNQDTESRNYFRKLSAARVAENAVKGVKGVNEEVIFGSKGKKGTKYVGTNEYRVNFGIAASANDVKSATKLLEAIITFMKDHETKAVMAAKVRQAAMVVAGDSKQLIKNNGTWVLNTGTQLSKEALTENGGLNLHYGSENLVNGIQAEAKVIRAAVEELQAAFKIQFPKQVIPNVPITTPSQQASAGTQSTTQAAPVEATAPVGKTGSSNTGRGTTNEVSGKMEASDVEINAYVDAFFKGIQHTATDMAFFNKNRGRITSEINKRNRSNKSTPTQPNQGATNGKVQEAAQAEVLSKTGGVTTPGKWEVTEYSDDSVVGKKLFATEAEAKKYQDYAMEEHGYDSTRELVKEINATQPAEDVPLKVTQAELTEAKKVQSSTNEEDYDNISPRIAEIIAALQEGDPIEVTEEAPASAVKTVEVVPTVQVEQPAVGEATTVVEEQQDGTLQAIQGNIDETTAYNLRNLAQYFTQVPGSIKDGSLRPLVAMKGFISWLGKDVSKAIQYVKHLTDSDSLTEEQTRVLNLFVSKSEEWQELIKNELIMKTGKSKAFKYEDMMQFFLQSTGEAASVDIEENLKTAISYAVFNYVINEAGEFPYFKNEEINKLLGRDKDHGVTIEERKVFHHKMMAINDVQNELGKVVFKALGLQAKKDIPTDIQPRLESAFGVHVMGLMENLKLVTVESIPYDTWNKFKNKKEGDTNFYVDEVAEATKTGFEKEKVVNTVRLARTSSMVEDKEVFEHTPLTAEILEANKDSKSILDKLFTLEPGVREPSLKPIPVKKTKPSRSTQGMPALLKQSLELTQKSARKIDATRMDLLIKLGDDIAMEIGGVDNEAEGSKAHINNRDGNKAKNDALRKEWKMLREFTEGTLYKGKEGKDTPFYLEFEAWIMQRVGIKTQAGNPLSSKIARGVIYSPQWEAKIMMNDLRSFKLRVLEGLGAKTDRKSNETSMKEFDETFDSNAQEPKIKEKADKLNAAIDAIIASFSGELTDAQKQAIVIGSKVGGEKMHSFAALVEMAKYRDALNKDKKHFTARMMGEMDGVTSGIMLSTLLYGAGKDVDAMFKRLNKGGLYRANEPSAYNIWRGLPGHKDQYENFAFTLESFLGKAEDNPKLTAIYGFIGSLTTDGNVTSQWRNFIKPAINAIAFGSGTTTVTERLGEAMIETYYASIEKAFASNDEAAAETIINNINQLLLGDFKLKPMSLAELMETPLSYAQTINIKQSFTSVFGVPIKAAMEQEFEHYVEKRNVVVQTSTVAFTIYSALKKSIREAYINELVANETIATTKDKGIIIHDLTQEQEDEVTKRMHGIIPLVHTAMSKRDGDKTTGILLSKPKSNVVYTAVNHSKVKYVINDKKVVNTYATRRSETNVGVSVLSKLLHAFDSAIMQQAIIEFDGHTFSAHDAGGTGIDTVDALGSTLNKYLWNELMNYSPAMEVYDMYALMLKTLASNIDSIPKETLIAVRNDLETSRAFKDAKTTSVSKLVDLTLTNIKDTADESDQMKYETLAVTAVVNQYSGETGVYTPTDEQRAEAALKAKQSRANAGTPEDIRAASIAIGIKLNALPPRVVIAAAPKEDAPDVDLNTKFNLSNKDAIAALSKDPKKQFEFIIGQLKNLPNKDLDSFIAGQPAIDKAKLIAKLIGFLGNQTAKTEPVVNDNWGGLGKPRRDADTVLLNVFTKAKGNTVNAKELLNIVKESVKTSKSLSTEKKRFYGYLMNAVGAALPAKLSVTMITKDTDPNSVDSKFGAATYPKDSLGWYDPMENGIGHIYLLGPEYKKSALTNTAVLHELLHGALAYAIGRAKNNPADKAAGLIKNLELILKAAREFVKETPNKYENALANIDELVSYGLTNTNFQKEVLEKLVIKEEKGKYRLLSGMKAFVEAITDFFFEGKASKAELESGMSLLIYSVSGLLSEQAKTITEGNQQKFVPFSSSLPSNDVNDFTTSEIHTALNEGKVTQGFTDHLQGLLDGIVTKLHGPFGSIKAFIAQSQASNPIDLWAEAMATGQAPFASELDALPISLSQQERFVADQVYATMVTAMDSKEGTTRITYKRLEKLYLETKERLQPTDFIGGQTEYDAIFKEESNAGGKSDYLARFAAIGLASQQMNRLLHVPTSLKTEKNEKKDVSAWLQNIFEGILEWFAAKFTHTPSGMLANVTLTALVTQLVNIENKSKQQLNAPRSMSDRGMAGIEKGAKVGVDFLREKAVAIASSKYVTGHTNAFVKAAGAGVRMVGNNQVNAVLDTMGAVYDQQFKGKQGVVGELSSYVRGALPQYQLLLRTLKHIEGMRKSLMTDIAQFSTEAFEKPPTEVESKGLTAVLMRTGAHNLLGEGKFSLMEIANLINDPVALAAAQDKYEKQMNQFGKLATYYRNSAEDLAWYKAFGNAKEEFTLKNAYVIANLDGTKLQKYLINVDLKKAEETIAILTTLYSIEYTSDLHKKNAGKVITQEMLRTQGNGMEYILLLHKELERKSLEDLFESNPTQMIHGYTPEIYNPHTEVRIANEKDGEDLVNQGFKKGNRVPVAASDPNKEVKHEYVLKGRGLPRRISGMVSTTGLKMKGSPKHNGFVNPWFADGLNNAVLQNTITQNTQAAIQAKFKPRARKKVGTATKTHLMPVLNDQGTITNWGYQMSEENKDTLLERTSDIGKVLGTMASSIFDKVESKKQNQKVIAALHEEWEAGKLVSPNAYIAIGPKSKDPELREQWNVLPEATKQEIRNVWGDSEIWVRGSQKNIIFGYQKYELAKMWDKPNRNKVEQLFVDLVELIVEEYATMVLHKKGQEAKDYARRSAMLVAKGQRGWQEMVQVSKDIIVVKTGVVMVGNIFSNFSQLMMSGVTLQEFVTTSLVALRGAMAYSRDEKELLKYQTMLDTNNVQGNRKEVEQNIVRLKDALARNPVKEMIDAGMMPTIVEDLAAEEDPYSYKTEFMEKVDEYTSKLNPTVVKAGKTVLMAHDTWAYMGLSRITQLSDFVARYTLYQHNINKKVDPMSKEDAMQESSEAFVNYDIPMPKGFQFMDDMGFMMFTKYFFSIQRQLLKLTNNNPARVLMTVALGNFMELGPTVLEGSFLTRFGNNPLGLGALDLPGNVSEMLSINSAMSLIK